MAKKENGKIKKFLSSEEGKMVDSDVLKTAIALGIIGAAMTEDLSAQNVLHTNYTAQTGHYSHGSHGSHASHGSHGSHGSHSRGGWC